MRIAFMGKGGSGKTSLAASYIHYTKSNKINVLAIDSDVNAHMAEALGLSGSPRYLSKSFSEIAEFLEGNHPTYRDLGISPIPSFGTVPPSLGTVFVRPDGSDRFLKHYAQQDGTLSLLTVGPHEKEDFSNSCYHFNLNSLELIFHRILDSAHDRVVTDSAAGTDSLGTSLYMAHDLTVMVVEPTLQSVQVFKDYAERVRPLGISLRYVANKVRSEADLIFLAKQIPDEKPLTVFKLSPELKAFEQGDPEAAARFVSSHLDNFKAIDTALLEIKKNWSAYYEKLTALYDAECRRWWNGYYEKDLTGLYDRSFQYPQEIIN